MHATDGEDLVGDPSDGGIAAWPDALPPGPSVSPEDQARLWLERPIDLLEACHREHGDLFTLRLGAFGTIVIVGDPEGVGQVFRANREAHECRHFNDSYRYVMGRHALFLQDGERHLRLKRILAPLFRGEACATQGEEICVATREVMLGWHDGGTIRVRPMTHEITTRSLLRRMFGDRVEPREQILDWFRSTVWRDLRSWKPWTSLSRLHPEIRRVLSNELAVRRGAALEGREPDLLDALLAARDEAGAPLTDEEIQDQVLMLTVTAGDAVAVATAWALYQVAGLAEVQNSVRTEWGAAAGSPAPAVRARLPYLSAVCQEVLRLHPVLPTVSGRRLTAAREFMGYPLAAGVTLAPCEYLVHRREDIFEQALAFRPQRFLGRTYAPQEYFPFGGGSRACLGSSLAPLTIKLVLATILSRFKLDLPAPGAPRIVRHGTLLAPEEALELRVSRHS
jgi:cytochrome P450